MQIPAPFDYVRATSVDNALELLSRHGPESRVVAGGHSLLPMMKLRLSRPEWLIDINDLYELDFILRDGDKLRIGALTRHTTLLESDEIAALFPIVRDAEAVIADPDRAEPGNHRRLALPGRPGRGPLHGLRRPRRGSRDPRAGRRAHPGHGRLPPRTV